MIKIFHRSSIWPGKVNFIDSNNVIVGYDLSSSCCEHAFWYISETFEPHGLRLYSGDDGVDPFELELDGYNFDPNFFERIDPEDDNGHAVFRLQSFSWPKEESNLYLHLENHQNGYYSHGFTFKGNKIIEGYL